MRKVRWALEGTLLLSVWLVMLLPGAGEWYARTVYPPLSDGLSFCASFLPFSASDCFIYGSIAALLLHLFLHIRKAPLRTLRQTGEYLLCAYLWFYLAWGLNYSRQPFYERANLEPARYDAAAFAAFLAEYTEHLNSTYPGDFRLDTALIQQDIKERYRAIAPRFGLKPPAAFHTCKPMICSEAMSRVGVLGYIGPFFNEATLNRELLPVQYPATCAHELAHVLGTAGEGEANFYAWLVCTTSARPETRFAGWFSLFPYVLSNARRLLPADDFEAWKASLRPEVKRLYNEKAAYWHERYSPLWGKAQDWIYNLYLRGNQVPDGTANYSEVVGMVMAYSKPSDGNAQPHLPE